MSTKFSLSIRLTILFCFSLSMSVAAETSYVVQRGDSFSSIAERLLNDASRWREIWALNPEVRTPALLKAGERLRIPPQHSNTRTYQPAAAGLSDPNTPSGTLSDGNITLAHDVVRAGIVDQTLSNFLLVEQPSLSRAPRIDNVSSEGNLQVLYVSGLTPDYQAGQQYGLFLPRNDEATLSAGLFYRTGTVKLAHRDKNLGKFSLLENSSDEISRAVILPLPPSTPTIPGYPSRSIESRITSVLYEQRPGFIVTLNQGSSSGIAKGHLLAYYKKDYIESVRGTNIEYPTGSAGTIMIIQTTTQSSLGVVLSARQTPAIDDRVRN
jgi:hypothetical protein